MSKQNPTGYEGHAHFRVPSDFMPLVHLVARHKGLTAASFMRMAILDALDRADHLVEASVCSSEQNDGNGYDR